MPSKMTLQFVSVLLFLLSIWTATTTRASDFLIFKEGKPAASILLPDNATDDLRMAVEVFRESLREGYSVELPLTQEGDGLNHIQLILEHRTPLTEDHTVVTFPSSQVMRITGGEAGVMRMLFVLLEDHAGVRFLYQGAPAGKDNRKRVYYPPLSQMAVPIKEYTHDSAFPLRRANDLTAKYFGVRGGGEENRRYYWGWQVQLGAKDRVQTGHALGSATNRHRKGRHANGIIFPIDMYADGSMTPPAEEAFPILKGKRFLPYKQPRSRVWFAHWQPCFTSQASEDEAVRNILAFMEKYPDTPSLSLSVNDNGNHCECADCLAMDGRTLNVLNLPDRSRSYYHWVNRVVNRVTQKHPDLLFGLIAYREVIMPPEEKLHRNVMVEITMDYQSTIDPQAREVRQGLIRQWNVKATYVSVYSYDVANWSWSLPRVYFQAMQEMIQYLHEHGGAGNNSEGAHYFTLSEGPRMYLYFKLLENPYLDRQVVIRDWCEAAVSKEAAGPLIEYFMFWENYWRIVAPTIDQFWDRKDATYLQRGHYSTYIYGIKPGDFAHCRKLMEEVVQKAGRHGTPDQKERAELLMTCFEWFEAAAQATSAQWINVDGEVASAEDAVSLLQDIPQAVKGHQRWREILTTTSDWIANTAVLANDRPGVVGFNMAWVLPWKDDARVKQALHDLSQDQALPGHLKRLAAVLADGEQAGLAPSIHDTFEDSAEGWAIGHPSYGDAVSSSQQATEGSKSLFCKIEHNNYAVEKKLPNLNKQADYFVTARLYIEATGDDAAQKDRTVAFSGTPMPVGWNVPVLKFSPGKWHVIQAYIPRSEQIDPDKLASQMGGVNSGQEIKDMLVGKLTLRLRNFAQSTHVYLDDVRVYELSDTQ